MIPQVPNMQYAIKIIKERILQVWGLEQGPSCLVGQASQVARIDCGDDHIHSAIDDDDDIDNDGDGDDNDNGN